MRRAIEENGELLQERLLAEIRRREAAERRLAELDREKRDLEILVQILTDEGDNAAEEGEKARIDALTQISNRRRFDEFLLREWGRHLRTRQPLALLICDIDHFKLYNDNYGHQAGDECLREVAKAISLGARASDLVARYGGEEFALVLPRTDRPAAGRVAERVLAAVAAAALPHLASPVCARVTLSIGVDSMAPSACDGAMAPRTLVERADQSLYLAKQQGRNRIGPFAMEASSR